MPDCGESECGDVYEKTKRGKIFLDILNTLNAVDESSTNDPTKKSNE